MHLAIETGVVARRPQHLVEMGIGVFGNSVTAKPNDGEQLPQRETGRRVHRFTPDGDVFQHEERFVSPKLQERYGRSTIVYDEGSIPREAVPDQYLDPDRPFTVAYDDTAVIGTFRQHERAEQQTRDQASDSTADAGTMAYSYSGPLYVYNSSSSNPDPSDLGERTGPINVGWDENMNRDAASVKSYMKSRGWTSWYAGSPGDRWVILAYYNSTNLYTKKQDKHIVKGLSTPSTQYHVRAYDLPSHSDEKMAVIGQAHKDPEFHDGPPWNFSETRNHVSGNWEDWGYSSATHYVGNGGSFDTSYGYLDRVY